MIRAVRSILIFLAVSAVFCLLLEGGARLFYRLRDGAWPSTFATALNAGRANSQRIYRAHPFLNTAPREGASTVASGRHMSVNSLGYRSPERPAAKPPGVLRIVTAGGSTTFDVLARKDETSWPWLLETDLSQRGVRAEVWNAGFPGWTSQENVIALGIRDLDLRPDVLVFYQGINDLQPAAQVPFDPQYEGIHASLSKKAIGIDTRAGMPWYRYSVLLENALPDVRKWANIEPPAAEIPNAVQHVPDEALAVFERNVRSFIALGRSAGARTLLVTQPLRVRAQARDVDLLILREWLHGLDPEAATREVERFNDVLRGLAANGEASLADAARDVDWTDADFGDPMHFSPSGSAKLAAYLTPHVAALEGR